MKFQPLSQIPEGGRGEGEGVEGVLKQPYITPRVRKMQDENFHLLWYPYICIMYACTDMYNHTA